MADRMEVLETQLSFQEDALASLNDAFASQQLQLQTLQREFLVVKQHLADALQAMPRQGEFDPIDEKPPHY
ncbi:MAG: putative coiled-coil protein SlyX [Pseudohongiellaceae bacterium]|jgi:uncharacterized coiled-coil protein SlyX